MIAHYTESEQSGLFQNLASDQIIAIFRSEALLFTDELLAIAKLLRENEDELSIFLPETTKWITYFENNAEHIWITIDCLTSPDLELPEISSAWIEGGNN
ncbi:MAG: hypothetical protein HUU38_19070 [Anaerolineales bacterium]|nr:hypothetical protein [Anaerolineales bacterium]